MKRSVNHALAAAVVGIGLAGGVVVAQAPTATTGSGTATTQAPGSAATGQGQAGQPGQPGQLGQAGHRGGGPGGQDGPGRGQDQAPTTASVTTEIGNLTQRLTSVKADRDFATGKMDLTTVNALIDKATALQTQAQTALTANNLTLASGDARAAESALRSADDLIVASIGTTGLPSAANRPARHAGGTQRRTTTDGGSAEGAFEQRAGAHLSADRERDEHRQGEQQHRRRRSLLLHHDRAGPLQAGV